MDSLALRSSPTSPVIRVKVDAMEHRRELGLLPNDEEYLNNTFNDWESLACGRWVLIHDFPIPSGFTVDRSTAAIRLSPAYPVTPLDMVYFDPPVLRSDGQTIPCTQATEVIDGKEFQRWSRHYLPGSWHPNEDDLATHVMAIKDWLVRAIPEEVDI